jgi:hypothetical protein
MGDTHVQVPKQFPGIGMTAGGLAPAEVTLST